MNGRVWFALIVLLILLVNTSIGLGQTQPAASNPEQPEAIKTPDAKKPDSSKTDRTHDSGSVAKTKVSHAQGTPPQEPSELDEVASTSNESDAIIVPESWTSQKAIACTLSSLLICFLIHRLYTKDIARCSASTVRPSILMPPHSLESSCMLSRSQRFLFSLFCFSFPKSWGRFCSRGLHSAELLWLLSFRRSN